MHTKDIQKIIGVIFLLITISVTHEVASGQQKNNSTFEQLNIKGAFKVYARGTSYHSGDAESAAGKTSSLIKINDVKKLDLECIAVDNKLIPYGSVIIGRNKSGQEIVGVAVDTGSAVKSRKAAIKLANKLGYSKDSKEAKAPVLDFHSRLDMTHYWDHFIVIPYNGPDFKFGLNTREKLEYLNSVKKQFVDKSPKHLLTSL